MEFGSANIQNLYNGFNNVNEDTVTVENDCNLLFKPLMASNTGVIIDTYGVQTSMVETKTKSSIRS